jgi:hypothetical protein
LEQDVLIEREYTTINQFGNPMHRTKEEWSYDRPGGPPKKYKKEIWSKAFVPAVNPHRTLTKMEEETTVFWTFTPYAPDVLAYRRQVDAYVVYNLKPAPDLTPEGEAKVEERGQKADGATDEQKRFHIASAQLWSEATNKGTVVEKADANQSARWVHGVIVEEVSVAEETDRYTQWGWRKFALRPDDVECIGPNYFQKESWNYRLDVPVEPPQISVSNAQEDGVRVTIRGGGAEIVIPLTTGRKRYRRGPEEYRVFRKKVDEAEREEGDDPLGIWEDGEAPPSDRRNVIVSSFVGGYDGTPDPAGGLPSQTSYTEPHDPDPVVDDSWGSVGTAKNEAEDRDYEEGRAVLFDKDVTAGSTYIYAATAVIQDTESPLSNQAEIEFDGAEPRSYRISVRTNSDGSVEGDLTMPDDPTLAFNGFGDTVDFTIPAVVDELGEASYPADTVTLTVAETVNVEEETFSITPPNIPEVWTPETPVVLTDVIGPGKPDASGILRPYTVRGRIVTQSGTTVTVTALNADDHLYPVGTLVEPQVVDDMGAGGGDELGDETGDFEESTIEALVMAVGVRQATRNGDECLALDLDVKMPLIGLQAGAEVTIVGVEWDAFGNDLWLQSQIEEVPWVLRGWEITVVRDDKGVLQCDGTKLKLTQR